MKKIILSLSFAFAAASVLAQQAEMDAAKSALSSGNFSEVLNQTAKAEELLKNNREIEPEAIVDLYFTAGQAAEKSNDLVKAGEYYAKASEIENNPYWKAKNKDSKNWEYFYDQNSATQITEAGSYSGLKEERIANSKMAAVSADLSAKANAALKKGNEAFSAKNYQVASSEFLKSYYLYQATGTNNNLLKYYAAISTLQTDEKEKAANLLQELVEDGYTGVQTNYFGKDKATGQEVSFSSQADLDTQVKLGLVTDPKSETTESIEEELYSNTTYAWYTVENWEKALAVGQKGLEKFPKNENMNQLVSGVYLKSGDATKFANQLQQKVQNGTANSLDYFNLARTMEDQNGSLDQIKEYYKKSIELDPKFTDAYLNLALAIIKPEKEFVELMNANLGTSATEKKIYTENQAKRKVLYEEALPHLEKAYELNPNNISIIKVLRNTYEVVGNDDKFFELKKIYEEKAVSK